ncbi:tyrosine-protein phosphatase [Limobrevibacterium gyesilva]|uniref:Tyrosine-protein phosphatase n=1 Tax=Limobrevibacterium gyesilva TaxID=2991712 RepID=A0AA41YS46_9PROT|nr:tyrosine-protein phosphatase [Limobrevibacterium gyesilva]MCW3475583.1 tyrosine-protein phosphatase [Limobrevibacterium gyesilva]
MLDADLPRALPLQGASNVRDLGGWPAAGGRRVRFGRVFRAAALSGLTQADAAVLAATGLGTVCDLRGEKERQKAPSRLPGVTTHALSIEPSLGASLRDIAARRTATGADVMMLMRRAYTAYALEWAHRYQAMFALLLAEDAPPLLFHCSAGKDRTGFGAALLLTALGVEADAVREDYLATNRLWRGDAELAAALPPAVADVLLRVHPELLDAAFGAIRESHGTLEAYLEQRIGVDAGRRAALQARLLE